MFATADDWASETVLIFRDDAGVWRINDMLYDERLKDMCVCVCVRDI